MIRRTRDILPRLELRKQDRRAGSYPNVARNGSADSGRAPITYVDQPVIFNDGVQVSMPTTLQSGTIHLPDDLATDIFVSSHVDKNAIENFVAQVSHHSEYLPYKEVAIHEDQILDSDFSLGSKRIPGFSEKLRDKSVYRFELPISSSTVIPGNSGSALYYNFTDKKFDVKSTYDQTVDSGAAVADLSFFGPWASTTYAGDRFLAFDPMGLPNIPGKSSYLLGLEDKLTDGSGDSVFEEYTGVPAGFGEYRRFNAESIYGQLYRNPIKGEYQRLSLAQPNGDFLAKLGYTDTYQIRRAVGTVDFSGSFVKTSGAPTAHQQLAAKSFLGLDQFLIEKIIVEFPIEAGPSWNNDRFSVTASCLSDASAYPPSSYSNQLIPAGNVVAMGGPAVTFAVLMDVPGFGREIIGSASFAPLAEKTKSLKYMPHFYYGAAVDLGVPPAPLTFPLPVQANADILFEEGLSDPTRTSGDVVNFSFYPTPNESGFFSGTVRLEIEPGILRGHTSIHTHLTASTVSGYPVDFDRRINGDHIIGFFDAGRTTYNSNSPHDLIGSTPGLPVSDSYKSDLALCTGTIGGLMSLQVQRNFDPVPYILDIANNLTFAIFKNAPCPDDVLSEYNTMLGTTTFKALVSDAKSHDIKIAKGAMRISIYGSDVSGGRERHNSLNQSLTSNEIHEVIGGETIIDRFETSYPYQLKDGYTSRHVTGVFEVQPFTVGPDNIRRRQEYTTNVFFEDAGQCFDKTYTDQDVEGHPELGNYRWSESGYSLSTGMAANVDDRRGVGKYVSDFLPQDKVYWDSLRPNLGEQSEYYKAGMIGLYYPIHMNLHSATIRRFPFENDASDNRTYDNSYVYGGTTLGGRIVNIDKDGISGSFTRTLTDDGWLLDPYRSSYDTEGNPLAYERSFVDAIYKHGDAFNPKTATTSNLSPSDSVKLLWGFGDAVLIDKDNVSNPNFPAPKIYYKSTGIGPRSPGVGYGVAVRGWKYGLYSGFPTSGKTVLSSRHHGFIRDVFEQPYETKWYDKTTGRPLEAAIQCRFYDQLGNLTSAEKTWSSNLSYECTCSVPYDDGKVRNREENIDITQLNIFSILV